MSCPVHPRWRRDAVDCPFCAELRPDKLDYLNGVIDSDGHQLPVPPEVVKEAMATIMEHGQLIAVLMKAPDGNYAVRVCGPPTYEIVDTLRQAADAIATGLKKHAS
jgi:hypothetical protein